MPSADHSRQALLRQADWLASVSSPRVRTNSFPSCTFGLYTAISVWPLGFNLSCSLTRQHMPETVSVRKVNGLPRASFSRNLAVQALPLAMCLAPPPALRDFHPVEFAHAERTRKSPRLARAKTRSFLFLVRRFFYRFGKGLRSSAFVLIFNKLPVFRIC